MVDHFFKLYSKLRTERKNIGFFFVNTLVSLLSSFVLMIAFANLIDKAAYGTYQYIISIATVIGTLSLTGIGPAFVRAIGKKEYGFLHYGQSKSIEWSLLPIAIGLLVSSYYLMKGNYALSISVFTCVAILTVIQYFSRFIYIFNGLGDFFKSNLILTCQSIAPLLFLFPLLSITKNPVVLAIAYVGSMALAILATNLYFGTNRLLKKLTVASKPNPAYNISNLKFAIHHSLINVINIATANFDKIFLFQMLGAHQTAGYVIAISLPNRIRALIKQFEPFVFARFAQHSASAVHSNLKVKFFATLILSIPFFLAYALTAPLFFKFFLPQYIDVWFLSIVYALSIFGGASLIPYAALKAHASEKYFYIYTFISSAVQVGSVGLGVLLGGLTGALIGKMLATLVNTFFVFILTQWIGGSGVIQAEDITEDV